MIYFDNAATTRVSDDVLNAMLPWFKEGYGNPSSIYAIGRKAQEAITAARKTVAECIGAEESEIYFTASGSEADNWALIGAMDVAKGRNKIITSAIEHHAVLHTCEYLAKKGFEVVYLPVDECGIVTKEALLKEIDDKTAIVSIMMANNEIGTIEPIRELAEVAHEYGALFHTDAVQAMGAVKVDVKELGVDMLSMSGHKIHAPKGVGALYIKKGVRIGNFIHGGAQERGHRAGTENTPYIVGFAVALKNAVETFEERNSRITALRDRLINEIIEKIPYAKLNGHPTKRLPGNVNFSFRFIEGESLLLMLDMKGFAASSGSACTSGSLDPSHVLLAIGLPHEIAHGSLRVSIGDDNTESDIDALMSDLPGIVDRLRQMSPLYEDFLNGKE